MWSAWVAARDAASCSTRAGSWLERSRRASSATRGWKSSDLESPSPTDDDGSGSSGSTAGKNHILQFSWKKQYITIQLERTIPYNTVTSAVQYSTIMQRYLKMDWMLLCIFILSFKILPSLSTNVTRHLQHCGVVDLIAKIYTCYRTAFLTTNCNK